MNTLPYIAAGVFIFAVGYVVFTLVSIANQAINLKDKK
jgi:hypothetical protein